MGATKRAAEMVVSALAAENAASRFMAVRFGNVLGSSSSVIPKSKEQIAKGGPVTVTYPDVTRYFMTIPEAALLVRQAASIGDSGQVLVLDMDDPARIVDLAKTLIRLAGHINDEIFMEFTGLRAGEKFYEELLADGATTLSTKVAGLSVALLQPQICVLDVLHWVQQTSSGNAVEYSARKHLRALVPEFRDTALAS